MTADARSRTVILAVALLGHVGLILLLAGGVERGSRARRRERPSRCSSRCSIAWCARAAAGGSARARCSRPQARSSPDRLPEIDSTGSASRRLSRIRCRRSTWRIAGGGGEWLRGSGRFGDGRGRARSGRGPRAGEGRRYGSGCRWRRDGSGWWRGQWCCDGALRSASCRRRRRCRGSPPRCFDRVAALAQGCESTGRAQHIVERCDGERHRVAARALSALPTARRRSRPPFSFGKSPVQARRTGDRFEAHRHRHGREAACDRPSISADGPGAGARSGFLEIGVEVVERLVEAREILVARGGLRTRGSPASGRRGSSSFRRCGSGRCASRGGGHDVAHIASSVETRILRHGAGELHGR